MTGLDILPSGNHRFDQLFFLDLGIEGDGCEVESNQRDQQVDCQFVDACQGVAQFLADQIKQRTVEGDVVIGEKSSADLKYDQCEQSEHRERAQRVMANAFPLAAQIGGHRTGGREETREAGVA